MTGRDLITNTMRLIGAIGSGETITAAEASDGLVSLNNFIDWWSAQGLLIPATVREEFSFIANQAAYTIGVGGGFNTSRPMDYIAASFIKPGTSPQLEIPIQMLSIQEWAEINGKNLTSDIQTSVYIENNSPLATLNFYPVPSATNKVAIYSLKPLTQLATLDTALALPPGYLMGMTYNFAIVLAPEYGKQLSAEIKELAIQTKADIQRVNTKPTYLKSDYRTGYGLGNYNHTTRFNLGE